MSNDDAQAASSSEELQEKLAESGFKPVVVPEDAGIEQDKRHGEILVEVNYSFNEYRKGDQLYVEDTPENRKWIEAGNFRGV